MMKLFFCALLLAIFASSKAASAPKNPFMLEISTRPFLYGLSQYYGRDIKLRDIPDGELKAIKDQGYDMVWMMGMWKLGQYGLNHDRTDSNLLKSFSHTLPGYTQDDIIGSPYAITEYVVNPDIGSEYDLQVFRKRLHSMGLLLMLDFVPNHSAVDSPYVSSNPEWYVHAPDGDHDPSKYKQIGDSWIAYGSDVYSGQWTDVLQFNWWNPDFVENFVTPTLKKIARLADGVRCDMSMLVLNDVFEKSWGSIIGPHGYYRPSYEPWKRVLGKAKDVNPNFVVIAEAYVYGITKPAEDIFLRNVGFDFTYEKQVLDRLKQQHPDWLKGWLNWRKNDLDKGVHFVENHDEDRAAATLGGKSQALSGAQVAFTLPGMRMAFHGERYGYKNKLDVHLRRAAYEEIDFVFQKQYDNLMRVIAGDYMMKNGTWEMLNIPTNKFAEMSENHYENENEADGGAVWAPEKLLSWRWYSNGMKRMVVANFNNDRTSGNIQVDISGNGMKVVKELLSGQVWKRDAQTMRDGFYMEIPAWSCQIVEYS
eukprot:TRINITY_DN2089_c0_g1_i1.p1 TRINITY_DN2089_c0_g1~~TRINITY_DN2089_c0_g1_i1.p1  ORF type:complete len:535 (+),score=149.07 TRINITY_DN2089_c0_g1_i1:81-1685(+)